jgi:hypothetical protein
LTDIVKRLRAYITANEDEMAPINMKADYMLIEEAAVTIESLIAGIEHATEMSVDLTEIIKEATDCVCSDHRDDGKDNPDLDVGC